MRALLATRGLKLFFAAHLQSQLGTGAGYVALVLIAYQRLHHGWAIALVLLADVCPGIALAVPFGVLADRLRRTRLAVAAEVLRAGAFVGLAVVSSFTATVLLALVAGVGTALFRPTIGAALPQLVSDEQRSPATALYGAITSLGITLGPAVTAPALLFFSPAMVLAVNGATFFISALLLSRVSLGVGGRQTTEEHPGSFWRSASEAFRVTRVPKGVGTLLLISAVSVFAGAVMNVAEPLLATGPLHAGNAGYSILIAFYGTGLVTGSLLCAKAGSCLSRLRRFWIIGNVVCGVGMIGSAAAPNLAAASCAFALTGAANAIIVAIELRLLQELVSPGQLGRALGAHDTLQNVAVLAAFLSAGALVSPGASRMAFAAGGAMLVLLAVMAAVLLAPQAHSESVSVGQLSLGD